MKKLQQMQKDLTQSTPVEKLTFPESEEDPIAQDQIQTVDISSKSVAKATIVILAILLLAYFLYEIQGLLVLFFISLFFASALDPPVDWLEKRKIPRPVGVLVIMMLFLGLFVVVIGSAIPIIVTQITTIASSISVNFVKLFEYLKSGAAFDYLPETIQANIISG
ncbi:MAG: AI-2E family transporter, partial [Deltaproteobacteria bacterium]|nr:AI-2E family transporter [Deltaproteobacteria bacterium]